MSETIADLLRDAKQKLAAKGIVSSSLDARLLLQFATRLDHAAVIADPAFVPEPEAARHFAQLLERRLNFEPVSRILGAREFYGRAFRITPDVLDPRPDTETLVNAVLLFIRQRPNCRILDLGTGSGAIIVTLLAEVQTAEGVACDISAKALDIARINATEHAVSNRLAVKKSNWFQRIDGLFDVILSNPPYIATNHIPSLEKDVSAFDPLQALDGGLHGLDAYRAIADGAGTHLEPSGRVFVEIGAGQRAAVEQIFTNAGWSLADVFKDFGRHARCLSFVNT